MILKGLYIMNDNTFDLVYPTDIRNEIEELADIYAPPLTSAKLKEDYSILQDAEVIFTGWGGPKLDEETLSYAPNLKAVFYGAGSIRGIVTDHFWGKDIKITSAVNANAIPVIEFTLSQILFSLKNGWRNVRDIRRDKKYPNKATTFSVKGTFRSTIGLISLSRIGRGVLELLKSFDVNVIAYDPFVTEEEAKELGVELCSLDDIFKRSDVVSLHTPWLKETEGLIKGEHFNMMQPNTSFINTARGAIVREEEMIKVLEQRPDITAVLDVTYPEPPVEESPLYTLENVVLTSHIAGSQGFECGRMGDYMLQEFKRFKNGESLKWEISKEEFDIQA